MLVNRFEKDTTELENEVERLEKECEELEMKWGSRSISDAKELVDKHIENLHEYNEIKDATQLIIGKVGLHS
ncbi:Mating-type switching protein swi5 [Zancudomyces culisetae]|uniref:Mating-type switching protein swi5 n=1 Tax=Zancudomyces culisetae TaxID=1213189 RepID=A0A1R1PMA1_ZANCU|nr:Mating-type switching protein swi5 [Zancudomyces culisetae]|eukprot:OMH82095.1 Mating-type switching protein swi5 [Zancudomyces culisetae]